MDQSSVAQEFSGLVERLRQGDESAATEFVARFEGPLRRHVRFLILDTRLRRVISESDICQSAIMQFFLGIWSGAFECRNPEETVRILRHLVRARMADVARRWHAQRRDLRQQVPLGSSNGLDQPADLLTPSRIVSHVELLEEVKKRLSEWELTILDLRQQKTSWFEIAARVSPESTPEAVRKRYERSLAKIAQELHIHEGMP